MDSINHPFNNQGLDDNDPNFLVIINKGWVFTSRCRDVAKVFNRRESCNDRRVFGAKAHSSMPLACYT